MNTDIRIDWHSGMEITPQTFIEMENAIAENRMMLRKILAAKVFGIIPKTRFSIDYEMAGSSLYINQIQCNALLPTGQVVVLESNVAQCYPIPMKEGCEMYFTVELQDNAVTFEKGDLRYLENECKFDFKALSEIRNAIPLLKLIGGNRKWSVYKDYVPPMVSIRSSIVLMEKFNEMKQSMAKLTEHENLSLLDNNIIMRMVLDQMNLFSVDDAPKDLAHICEKVISFLSYTLYGNRPEMMPFSPFDAERYLNGFISFAKDALVAMTDLSPKEADEPEPVEDVFTPII
ncbi:MAG: hypothetical protein ACTTKO_08435 [Candidatus Limimorpha sp.]